MISRSGGDAGVADTGYPRYCSSVCGMFSSMGDETPRSQKGAASAHQTSCMTVFAVFRNVAKECGHVKRVVGQATTAIPKSLSTNSNSFFVARGSALAIMMA